MNTFMEYELEDGTTILVKVPDDGRTAGLVRAGNEDGDVRILKAEKKLSESFHGIRRVACTIKQQFEELQADEVEVKFCLLCTGKLANFAIGEVGVEANYEITLKWNNAKETKRRSVRPKRHNEGNPLLR